MSRKGRLNQSPLHLLCICQTVLSCDTLSQEQKIDNLETMRIIRYQHGKKKPAYGWLLEDKVGPIKGDIYGAFQRGEASIPFEKVKLLTPVQPGQIICVARNYAAHASEHGAVVPEVPALFFKPPSAVIGPGEAIVLPPQAQRVEQEAELAVVIGKQGRWIAAEEVDNHILGYTIANDVTDRIFQREDLLWTRGKGFDTFAPIGPWIETDFSTADAIISCRVNGDLRQMASTREMVHLVGQLIAFASSFMTLMPGDVLFTGTPEGVSKLEDGDLVEIEIEGIGTLTNPVIQAKRD
jgi:2-keto-4-pentenoate hydratase/2-oxohepta-3-ene-1,7-dioic acid hydratase in catechol pathway